MDNDGNTPSQGTVEGQGTEGVSLLDMLKTGLDSERGEQPAGQAAIEKKGEGDQDVNPADEGQDPVDELDELANSLEEDDDEDNEPEEKSDSGKFKFKLRADDTEEIEVTTEELINGYRRQSDYTKDKQELAEEKKRHEIEVQEFSSRRQKTEEMEQAYAFMLGKLRDVTMVAMRDFLPSQEQLDEMRIYDPASYLEVQERIANVQKRLNLIDAERNRIIGDNQKRNEESVVMTVRQEAKKILEVRPEWADEKKRSEDAQKIVTYAKSIGYGDDELQTLIDHRGWVVLDEARKYREIVERSKKLKEGKVPTKKSSGGSNGTPVKGAVARPADVKASLGHLQKNPTKPGALAGFLLAQGIV